jgi:multiple sugar transport system permease protein
MGILMTRPSARTWRHGYTSWSARRRFEQVALHVGLVAVSITVVLPFLWLFLGSFKPFSELVSSIDPFPKTWTLDNYREIIAQGNFLAAFVNSIVVSTLVTLSVVIWSTLLGYIFAKYRFRGRDALFYCLLATMMVPFAIEVLPLYLLIARLGLADTLAALIVPNLLMTLGIFVMRQFIETIPSDYVDACRIDGAGELRVVWNVIVPLSRPAISAVAIVCFLAQWDNFFWPSIVLRTQRTLPLLLNSLESPLVQRFDLWLAASVITVTPVMIVYLLFSRQFIRGVLLGGIR